MTKADDKAVDELKLATLRHPRVVSRNAIPLAGGSSDFWIADAREGLILLSLTPLRTKRVSGSK